MAIVVAEKYKGFSRDASSAEIIYLVTGTDADAGNVDGDDAFDAVLGAAPAEHDGIAGADIEVRQELVQGTHWLVAAVYGNEEGGDVSQVDYEFSFQAPQGRIYQSLETIGIYSVDGEEAADMFGGAINVSDENGDRKVEGLDLPSPSPTMTWVYKPLSTSISTAYQQSVEAIMGDVNSFAFKSRPAGTMRFVSCDGGATFSSKTQPRWSIRFGFQFSANRSAFEVSGIEIPFKGGHHLLWAFYEDGFAAGVGPIKRPKLIAVERIFPESNFSVLGID